jgi:hypothetical protein
MRNYYQSSGLRPKHKNEEPELQWLEDSINYLATTTFICIKLICVAVFRGIVRAYEAAKSGK